MATNLKTSRLLPYFRKMPTGPPDFWATFLFEEHASWICRLLNWFSASGRCQLDVDFWATFYFRNIQMDPNGLSDFWETFCTSGICQLELTISELRLYFRKWQVDYRLLEKHPELGVSLLNALILVSCMRMYVRVVYLLVYCLLLC